MRSFLIAWVVAFLLVAIVASGVSWYVAATPPVPVPTPRATGPEPGPFSEADAIEIVGRLLPTDATGDASREQLRNDATVTYHSPQHWRVCFDGACWVAHGPGRYAEAENDAARQREGTGRSAP